MYILTYVLCIWLSILTASLIVAEYMLYVMCEHNLLIVVSFEL